MRDLIILLVHFITTVFRLARPGGLRSVVAESVLIKHQLLIVNRSRRRAPNLRVLDRLIAGFCSLWIKPTRLRRAAIALKPSTVLHFHRALVQRKYRLLFSRYQSVMGNSTESMSQNQQLTLHDDGLSNHRSDAARSCKSNEGDDQVDEKDEVAHAASCQI